MSHEIILHEYGISLFAEKIRRILAFKNIPYRSVEQPNRMPKPGLVALTGGYRRIPVLQIGADVYCDTSCIARRLEQLFPDPPCIPETSRGLVAMLEEWADHRFTGQVVPSVIVELLPVLPPDILDDRAQMSPMLSKQAIFAMAPHTRAQSLLSFDHLEERLGESEFLAGDSFTLADAACYHPLWFLRHVPHLYEAVAARPRLAAWVDRIAAFGPGRPSPMSADDALAVARSAEPADVTSASVPATGFAAGDSVSIRADDFGQEITSGSVARVTADEIVLRREDPDVGTVAVHFPRSGYVLLNGNAARAAA